MGSPLANTSIARSSCALTATFISLSVAWHLTVAPASLQNAGHEVEIGRSRIGRTREKKTGRSRNWPKSIALVATRQVRKRPREVGEHPFSTDATLVCPRNRFDQGCGWLRTIPTCTVCLQLQSPTRSPLGLSKWGIGLTAWAEHQPKKPRMPRASFTQLNEIRGHQVAAMFYLGQSHSGQFLLRPVLLEPSSTLANSTCGQFYLGQFCLGQVYLGQVRLRPNFCFFFRFSVIFWGCCCVVVLLCCVSYVVVAFAETRTILIVPFSLFFCFFFLFFILTFWVVKGASQNWPKLHLA